MTSKLIRTSFFEFFQNKGHQLVPSAPIVIKDDPTLMFTNAGMNQFKELFLGNEKAEHKRVVDTQKCLRVSGKHNDLEEVGVDTYHHTMFEMLGNWSFGDYFKEEMIPWSWEFLTEVLKIDKDRLYVTTFQGDREDNLEEDVDSYHAWEKIIAKDRIIKASKADNFWEMGEVGPCGPCSEIHVDIRSDDERGKVNGRDLVNKDHPQVVEIWNLVFMEFNRKKDKSLEPLPAKHVDTGMGLERLCMVLQDKQSNYDTDLFTPLLYKMEEVAQRKYTATDKKEDVAFRVIVDHIRAIAFSISDGQLPSNAGAGYVIRRILRRAVRYGYSFLGLKEPFLHKLLDVLNEILGSTFPELQAQKEIVKKVVLEEENSFLHTLERGIHLFEDYVKNKPTGIDGKFAFELYDTYGFPIDLTELLAEEKNLEVDLIAFESELKKQKERSRAAGKITTDDWVVVREGSKAEFVGYDNFSTEIQILRYRKVEQNKKKLYQLVFDKTPFYPEGGGQVGDTGYLEAEGVKLSIVNTKKENNLIVHFSKELPHPIESQFKAVVNTTKRQAAAVHHSATHLLHQALRKVLGTHIEQKGSLVHPDYLRFDFSHFQKVNDEELEQIEDFVNQKIRENIALNEKRNTPIEKAKEMGAIALFGEKYGNEVRVIQFGESIELCGGTHVKATGEIGLFNILSEAAVASGIRRIEAHAGEAAWENFKTQRDTLSFIYQQLKRPKNLNQAMESLLDEKNTLQKELGQLQIKLAQGVKKDLLQKLKTKNGINILIEEVDLDAASIKNIAFQLKSELENLFLVLASKHTGKPNITVLISENLVKEKNWNAAKIVRELAQFIQGGGGGQAFFATAGGKNANGIEELLKAAQTFVN